MLNRHKKSSSNPPSRLYSPQPSYHDNDEKESQILSIRDTSDAKVHILPSFESKKVIEIICGYNGTTYIILADGTFMIYGYNAHGALGLGHFDYISHTEIPKWCKRLKIKKIFSGITSKHSLAITKDNKLYGVGNNCYNQFGAITNANTLSQWTEITKSFPENIENIKCIATGHCHTTFLTENGKIYQTMDKHPYIKLIECGDIKFRDIKCGKSHILAISKNDELYGFGQNQYGQLGFSGTDHVKLPFKITFFDQMAMKIKQIACGQDHSLVLTKQNKVYCFGRNDCYQIGNGSNYPNIIKIPQRNETLEHEDIIDIKCGGFHNLVKTQRNEYFFWGRNKENQCLIKANNNDYDERFNMDFIKRPTKYLYNKQSMEIMDIYLGHKETKIVMKQIYDENGEIFNNDKDNGNKICSENDRNSRKKMKISKFGKFKAWCNKLKKSKNNNKNNNKRNKKDDDKRKDWSNDNNTNDNNTNNNKHLNGLENIYGLDDNKYHDREYVNHEFVACKQWSSCSSSIVFTKRLESIEEIPEIESNDNDDTDSSMSDNKSNYYCYYYSPKMHNSNNIGNDIEYQPMTLNKS